MLLNQISKRHICTLCLTFPVQLIIGVVQDVGFVGCVQIVHVDVQVIRRVEQVVFALIQREADPRGRELFPLRAASITFQRQSSGRSYEVRKEIDIRK